MRAESPNEQLDRWAQEKRQLDETRRRNLERAREAKRAKALQSESSGSVNASLPAPEVECETASHASEARYVRESNTATKEYEAQPAERYSAATLLLGIASTLITKLTIDFLYPRLRDYFIPEPVIRSAVIDTPTETYYVQQRESDWRWKGQSVFK